MNKNDVINLEITGMTTEGNGVGKAEDGMAVFVPVTAVGDVISCKIVKICKSYAYGIVDDIITPSKSRTLCDCNVDKLCGGCSFRHILYKDELLIKQNFVKDAFERIGGFSGLNFLEIEGSPTENFYRNKAQLPVDFQDGKTVCGFYSKRSHRVVACENCKLEPPIFSEISSFCTDYFDKNGISPYDEKTRNGYIRHIYIRKGFHSGEIMLCLVSNKISTKKIEGIVPLITEKFPKIKTIVLNINSENTNVILGKKFINLFGEGFIYDTICGNKVKLSANSFYQINTAAAENLYGYAKKISELKGDETVIDLYCGAGTIGLSFADTAKEIIGCEIIEAAIEDAKHNAEINGYKNTKFYAMDASKFAEKLANEKVTADVIVVDPPRKGCDEKGLASIVKIAPEKVVMISCNPSTAARDAKYLSENGYEILSVKPFDLFPRTTHVECIVLMSKVAN